MTIDLATLKPTDEAVEISLLHPTEGHVLGPVIRVYGSDSQIYKKASADLQSRRIAKLTPGKMKLSSAEIEEDTLTLLATCTEGWEGIVIEGKKIEYSLETAKKLYRDYAWIREQVDRAVSDRANFMKASTPS